MYPTTTTPPHGFNHQSSYRQPTPNLRQINGVTWNQSSATQQSKNVQLNEYSKILNQLKQTYSTPQQTNVSVVNTTGNYVGSNLPPPPKVNHQTVQQLKPTNFVSNTYQNGSLVRQSSVGALPDSRHVSSKESTPLPSSRSMGRVHDQIQRERRAHTMAPMSRITGPSLLVTGNLFASTIAPSDARTINTSQPAQENSNTINYGDIENDNEDDDDDDEEEGEDEDEEDEEEEDDGPIIVKVRYDPTAGGPPPEDLIRQAVDNQLKAKSNSKQTAEPIVLNFLDKVQIPNDKAIVTSRQPVLNQSKPSIPQQSIQIQQQIPTSVSQSQLKQQNLSLLQQRHQQHQQFLQQQQKYQQQLLEQQRLQQQQQKLEQQKLQQQKLEQQRLQQQKLEQQRLQQQKIEQQRLQQHKLEQQRLQQHKLEQQRLQQQILEQQRRQQIQLLEKQQREKQQLAQYLQQTRKQNEYAIEQQRTKRLLQLDNQRIQRQVEAEQSEINRLITQQLQRERQQHRYQTQRHSFQQPQRKPPIYSQQQQQYASLPPMVPRPSRSQSYGRPVPNNQAPFKSQQNSNFFLLQHSQSGNLQYNQPIHISRQPNIAINRASNSFASGPGLYASLSHQNLPYSFVPIQSKGPIQQQPPAPVIHNKSLSDLSPAVIQRPHTAPSSTELFRTPSTLDIPELSKENLSNMLGKIPDLSGYRFNIEYAEPKEPINIPIPSQVDGDNDKYPEAVIVDQLPTNILQHVSSSDNLELKSALSYALEQSKNLSTKEKSKHSSLKLKDSLSKVLHHKARPKHKVKEYRAVTSDESDTTSDTSSTEETEEEETVIENVIYPVKMG